jgi:hypothetical protein
VGGFLRNSITRNTLSTKYALCVVGKDGRPVIKKSEVRGKQTLPMAKVLRDPDSLACGKTLVSPIEDGKDSLVNYFNGINRRNPFGEGMYDLFPVIQQRVLVDYDVMPLEAGKISDILQDTVDALLEKYANVIPAKTV